MPVSYNSAVTGATLRLQTIAASGVIRVDKIIEGYKENLLSLLSGRQIPFDENLRSNLSTSAGVYRIFEVGANWRQSVYVGKSTNIKTRIYGDHFIGNPRASTLKRKLIDQGRFADEKEVKEYLRRECLVQWIEVEDDLNRTWLEHFAAAILRPGFND